MYFSSGNNIFSYALHNTSVRCLISRLIAQSRSACSTAVPSAAQQLESSTRYSTEACENTDELTVGDIALQQIKAVGGRSVEYFSLEDDVEWNSIIEKANKGALASTNKLFFDRVVLPKCSLNEYYQQINELSEASPYAGKEKRDIGLFKQQIDMEIERRERWMQEVKDMEEQKMNLGMLDKTAGYNKLERAWHPKLKALIDEDIAKVSRNGDLSSQLSYVPYIMYMDSSVLAKMIIRSVISCTVGPTRNKEPPRAADVAGIIGGKVEQYAQGLHMAEKIVQQRTELRRESGDVRRRQRDAHDGEGEEENMGAAMVGDTGSELLKRQKELRKRLAKLAKLEEVVVQHLEGKARGRLGSFREARDVANWGSDVVIRVGAHLLLMLMQVAEVEEDGVPTPAFTHDVKLMGGRRAGILVAQSKLHDYIANDESAIRGFVEGLDPMLVEPKPWTAPHSGGYLVTMLPILKTGYSHRLLRVLYRAHDGGLLNNLYDGLNAVGSTPWRINSFILETMQEAYAQRMGSARVPDPELQMERPRSPLEYLAHIYQAAGLPYNRGNGSTSQSTFLRLCRAGPGGRQLLASSGPLLPEEQKKLTACRASVTQFNCQKRTDVIMFRRKVELATRLATLEKFFLPCQVDFRGRAYPIHHLICQTGDDVSRGLLLFASGKPLGPKGVRWLKIQLANLWGNGIDKMSIENRINFIESNMHEVFDAADAPLTGGRWWLKSEKPWEFLAASREIALALRSDNPEAFVSHLPVHQDGTCNGLQHYAALGRDVRGARAVNLLQCEKPADVYTEVSRVVLWKVQEEAARQVSEAVKAVKYIDRKLVKQTVMTYVYGVTYVGARAQIENRLREKKFHGNESELKQVANYLTKHTFESLGEVFSSARSIMEFFSLCARVITANGNPVCWTSPIGFPVHQPYVKKKMNSYGRGLLKHSVSIYSDKVESTSVDPFRQCLGLPPNFIHSLDASHMFMTAAACKERGIDFASVHDSFWVHACHVDELGEIIRDSFVELHSIPWLEHFREEAAAQNPDVADQLPPLPVPGALDLNEVRKSTFFFS